MAPRPYGMLERFKCQFSEILRLLILCHFILPPFVQLSNNFFGNSNSTVKIIKQQQKHLSEQETRTIVEKYKAGISTYELAQEFGCHRYTISNALKRSGIVVDKHAEGRKYKTEEVIRLYKEEKKSVAEPARMFGVCDATIYKCLKRNNIPTNRTRWDYER